MIFRLPNETKDIGPTLCRRRNDKELPTYTTDTRGHLRLDDAT